MMSCQRLDMEVYVSQRDKVKSTFPPGLVCECMKMSWQSAIFLLNEFALSLGSQIYKAATLAFRKSIYHDWNYPAETTTVSLFILRSQYISHMIFFKHIETRSNLHINTKEKWHPYFYANRVLNLWYKWAWDCKSDSKVLSTSNSGCIVTAGLIQLEAESIVTYFS